MNSKAENVICEICAQTDKPNDILMEDGFYPSLKYHIGCINSAQGKVWKREKFNENPAYDRYWDLQTVGKPVDCSSCGLRQAISAKARGMGAGNWELVCDCCHRVSPQSLSCYKHPQIYDEIEELERVFLLGQWDENCEQRIRSTAKRYHQLRPDLNCICGGQYSILGKPRCVRCDVALLDSYFHYSYKP